MTDEPDTPNAVVLIVNLRGVAAWVSRPADLAERRRRGAVDAQLRREARLAASWTSRPPSTSTTWRN
jgi:hypothetical protein